MSCFTYKVDNGPVLFPLLKVIESQFGSFVPSQPAGKQQGKQRPVPFPL
jgi:hypothetical protein